ncbi:unnamed protein product, partial [Mesorhabditis belari]|uniref:Uncharacterized protein n=1 Tax=Mesorhabditis belari TaxID=2138241 RepID=A0AAF3FF47_9BILA
MNDEKKDRDTLLPQKLKLTRKRHSFIQSLYLTVCSVQFGAMLLLTAQQTGMPLLVREVNRQTKFFSTTSVFMMEVIRLITCSIIISINLRSPLKFLHEFRSTVWHNKIETAKVCVPAVVYAIQNNLYYVALANIDATTYAVTYQLRILTTALLSVLILSKRLSLIQWFSLLVSMGGVVLVQLDESQVRSSSASSGSWLIGVSAVFSMCWTSAFAGVYFEKMLKKSSVDVWMQNIRLSMLTAPFALITMFASDFSNIQEHGFFNGWTPLVWVMTFLNAFGGLVVSIVMKYADNVKKTYCQTIAIGLTALISIKMGDSVFSVQLLMGVSLVIASVFLYSFYPPQSFQNQQNHDGRRSSNGKLQI